MNNKWATELNISGRKIGSRHPTFFIADIAANHDGDLNRAKELIWLAKHAGADCAKFQHFLANKIVSKEGFSGDWAKVSHQSGWSESVVETYDRYHTKREWTLELVEECRKAEIEFMTTPYDIEIVDEIDAHVNAYKVGSGDITFGILLDKISQKGKPVFLATGASELQEVVLAFERLNHFNPQTAIMQCNTNYTGSLDNFRYVNLNVLKHFQLIWPGIVTGLSDHTPGHSAILGAITLGARVIEKHFTDDNERAGPDHSFALNPVTWKNMIDASRELEYALGNGIKQIEENEAETKVIQRRAIRMAHDLSAGHTLTLDDFDFLSYFSLDYSKTT